MPEASHFARPHCALYRNAGTFDITKLVKLIAKCLQQSRLQILGKHTDPVSWRRGLLRLGCDRNRSRRSTEGFEKFPPPHAALLLRRQRRSQTTEWPMLEIHLRQSV